MADNKTKATRVSPAAFIGKLTNEQQRKDAKELVAMMKAATGEPPKMWGPTIVGFGTHTYPLAGGKEGTICRIGFSPRKPSFVLYIGAPLNDDSLMSKLGPHTRGKGCLYIKKLDDVDRGVLKKLITKAVSGRAAS